MTHTPGPWLAERVNPSGGVLIEAGELFGGIIATVWESRPTTQVADAQLIAAAPDLYAALADYVDQTTRYINGYRTELPDATQARAALAKVRP